MWPVAPCPISPLLIDILGLASIDVLHSHVVAFNTYIPLVYLRTFEMVHQTHYIDKAAWEVHTEEYSQLDEFLTSLKISHVISINLVIQFGDCIPFWLSQLDLVPKALKSFPQLEVRLERMSRNN
jgi:hypothetical protein